MPMSGDYADIIKDRRKKLKELRRQGNKYFQSKLIVLLKENNREILLSTLKVLGLMRSKESLVILSSFLGNTDDSFQAEVMNALGNILENSKKMPELVEKEIVPKLVLFLEKKYNQHKNKENDFSSVSFNSAKNFAKKLGKKASDAVPVLVKIFIDNKYSDYRVEEALIYIGGKAVEPLLEMVENRDLETPREVALEMLGRIGLEAREAVPTLLKYLDDKEIGNKCIETLAFIGVDDEKTIGIFLEILKSGCRVEGCDSHHSYEISSIIERMKTQIIPIFIKLLKEAPEAHLDSETEEETFYSNICSILYEKMQEEVYKPLKVAMEEVKERKVHYQYIKELVERIEESIAIRNDFHISQDVSADFEED